MDGEIDAVATVKLMRSVIGRKIMEIDDYNSKAENATGEEAGKMVDMIEFLNCDIAGYKTIVDDLKDGSCDYTANLGEIASLPAKSIDLYNNFYLPSLTPEDHADEEQAMTLKGVYAQQFARIYATKVGRTALTSEMAVNLMMADDNIAAAIGLAVLGNPEILDALKNENATQNQ
ncbi:MAG: hypothetical protein WCQ63_02200 [Methanomethylophilus sp.]|nr:hypothetical protein [Methanomethylophilus sp.]MDD4222728.1 hypothetical protein [Methanomethylophilus sp.]MDD4668450.1 hypothetical protein [Methanomethylophilus sp.]